MRENGAQPGVLAPLRRSKGPTEEETLIALARQRDSAAWATLFDRYYPLLYRYAYARLGSREEAEDAASQAFLNAYGAIGRFQYRGRPMLPWLYTITRNIVNKKRRQAAPAAGSEAALELAVDASQDDELLTERIDLARAVGQLNQAQREVVVFRFALGLTMRETADIVGKSEAAVHGLQVRALNALRRYLRR